MAVAGGASLAAWAALGRVHIARAAETGESHLLRTLIRIARLIYPHDGLADAVYAGIVGKMLEENGTVLRPGLAALGRFLELSEKDQVDHLRAIEHSEFFEAVREPLMWALYNTRELWELIGYPGPSFPFGGYVGRGFDDIDWLPE